MLRLRPNRSIRTTLLAAAVSWLLPAAAPAGFFYTDFVDDSRLRLNGDAQPGTVLTLTPPSASAAGSTWYQFRQHVRQGFNTFFEFRTSAPDDGSGGGDGAEGFAFVIQHDGPRALGTQAAGLGYSGIPNSLAIEFDMADDPVIALDPDGNHISVQSRGLSPNDSSHDHSLGDTGSGLGIDMADGEIHQVRIEYRPEGELRVYLDDLEQPLLFVAVDLDALLDLDETGRAWVGFTASTGEAWQAHEILRWYLREDVCNLEAWIDREVVAPGEDLEVRAYLQHNRQETVSEPFSLWIEDADGNLVVGTSTAPRTLEYGDELELHRILTLPESTAVGEYELVVGIDDMEQGVVWKRIPFHVE